MVAHAPARAHAGTGHDDSAARDIVQRPGLGLLARQVQSVKTERIMPVPNALGDFRLQGVQVALHDFGHGDRHRRVDIDLRRRRQAIAVDALMDNVDQLLRPLHREGRNDDIAAARKCLRNGLVELLDRWLQGFVIAVAVGRFHHDIVCVRRFYGVDQQGIVRFAEIT